MYTSLYVWQHSHSVPQELLQNIHPFPPLDAEGARHAADTPLGSFVYLLCSESK